ncbi:hypothetical protein MNBD_GAMMA22-2737 [hydrothermal vent metagenome]|uniref:Uncharacterized protein n=1 Tax=hydrothermal vent metagenome TaxID=652676 RepID=A0A3B0ZZT4_9ZZZZ
MQNVAETIIILLYRISIALRINNFKVGTLQKFDR